MAKAPNYTAEMVEKMIADYQAEPTRETVEAIAGELGKSVRSVISKLVRENVYVAPEKPAPAPKPEGPTKGEMLTQLAEMEKGIDVDGMTGATKAAIQSVIDALTAEPEAE